MQHKCCNWCCPRNLHCSSPYRQRMCFMYSSTHQSKPAYKGIKQIHTCWKNQQHSGNVIHWFLFSFVEYNTKCWHQFCNKGIEIYPLNKSSSKYKLLGKGTTFHESQALSNSTVNAWHLVGTQQPMCSMNEIHLVTAPSFSFQHLQDALPFFFFFLFFNKN